MDVLINILRFSSPVAWAAMGESVGQKAGVMNIGLEGMMLSGSFAAIMTAKATGSPWIGMGAGIMVALVLCLVQSLFTLKLFCDQVVVGAAINLLSLGVTGTLWRIQLSSGIEQTRGPVLPRIGPDLDIFLLLLPAAAGGLWWVLTKSRWGLAMQAAGEHPSSVTASGFDVGKIRLQAQLVAASFAGLAGGYHALGTSGAFAENMTNGRGFLAIAMVTFGRWRPVWILAASFVIGAFDQLQFMIQASGSRLPYQLFVALPYLAALFILVFSSRSTRPPAALGIPYRSES